MTGRALCRAVLAIDAAGLTCSVAVSLGEKILAQSQIDTLHGQAEALLPLVDRTMREAGQEPSTLEAVVVTVGPGSFTGIRVGLAAARGIALATGACLIGVTSFAAVAAGTTHSNLSDGRFLLVALESRREDLYIQLFEPAGDPLAGRAVVMPSELGEEIQATVGAAPLLVAGDAALRAAAALAQRHDTRIVERCVNGAVGTLRAGLRLWRLGRIGDAPRPLYLRRPDVTLSGDPGSPNRARK
ncbi:MAG: tRNA (adenosine(37)-N6)-threonylcarbamoyltransferase complex dimerization subunit type 1 TsaB [Alphaproteobacteria bacterium]|nr:tRNA (adenosine(37)-N6)-threonylcarbamoyltransferase complex dimerization subunit type 1 TsaB [Alphaproteobacteria bacterium]